jgi:hypothetical protein
LFYTFSLCDVSEQVFILSPNHMVEDGRGIFSKGRVIRYTMWYITQLGYNGEYLRYGLDMQGLPRHSVDVGALLFGSGAFCEEVSRITAYKW